MRKKGDYLIINAGDEVAVVNLKTYHLKRLTRKEGEAWLADPKRE